MRNPLPPLRFLSRPGAVCALTAFALAALTGCSPRAEDSGGDAVPGAAAGVGGARSAAPAPSPPSREAIARMQANGQAMEQARSRAIESLKKAQQNGGR